MPQATDKWQEIQDAALQLELNERATLQEIKRAFRRLAKRYHPDRNNNSPESIQKIRQLQHAYNTLLNYCATYRFPLAPGLEEEMDDEQWWQDRFGNDPVWGGC